MYIKKNTYFLIHSAMYVRSRPKRNLIEIGEEDMQPAFEFIVNN